MQAICNLVPSSTSDVHVIKPKKQQITNINHTTIMNGSLHNGLPYGPHLPTTFMWKTQNLTINFKFQFKVSS